MHPFNYCHVVAHENIVHMQSLFAIVIIELWSRHFQHSVYRANISFPHGCSDWLQEDNESYGSSHRRHSERHSSDILQRDLNDHSSLCKSCSDWAVESRDCIKDKCYDGYHHKVSRWPFSPQRCLLEYFSWRSNTLVYWRWWLLQH